MKFVYMFEWIQGECNQDLILQNPDPAKNEPDPQLCPQVLTLTKLKSGMFLSENTEGRWKRLK